MFAQEANVGSEHADRLRDDAPLVRARLPVEAQSEHHEEDSNLNELRAGLHCHHRFGMTSSEGGLEVDLGREDRDVEEKSSSNDGPIDNSLDACTGHAWEEPSVLTRLLTDAPDDRSKLWVRVSRSFSTIRPSSSMVFCFSTFIGASRMPGILLAFPRGVAEVNVLQDKLLEEFGLK